MNDVPSLPDADEVVPEGADPKLVAALAQVESHARSAAELKQKVEELSASLAEASRRQDVSAFCAADGNPDGARLYEDCRRQRAEVQAALERALSAWRGAVSALNTARQEHHSLNFKGVTARFARLTASRARSASELQEVFNALDVAFAKFNQDNGKLASVLLATGPKQVFGLLLDKAAIDDAMPYHARAVSTADSFHPRKPLPELISGANLAIMSLVSSPPKFEGDVA